MFARLPGDVLILLMEHSDDVCLFRYCSISKPLKAHAEWMLRTRYEEKTTRLLSSMCIPMRISSTLMWKYTKKYIQSNHQEPVLSNRHIRRNNQCLRITRHGNACRRKTKSEQNFCWQHGFN